MAKYGSDDLGIKIGGTEMKNYIDTINDFAIEALLQEGTAFGDSWVEQLYTGIKKGSDLTLEGFYDDAATTGPASRPSSKPTAASRRGANCTATR